MRAVAPEIRQVRVLAERSVQGRRLMVAFGSARPLRTQSVRFPWDRASVLGVFLQTAGAARSALATVAMERGSEDCAARVERVAADEVVVSCVPEKGDRLGPTHRLELDVQRGRLQRHATFRPVAFARALPDGRRAVLVGDDEQKLFAVAFDPARYRGEPGGGSGLFVLPEAAARPWFSRVQIDIGSVSGEERRSIQKEAFRPVRFGPGAAFRLVEEKGELVVQEGSGEAARLYRLPHTTPQEWARLRPTSAAGLPRGQVTIAEAIGPWQVVDGTLWFAKQFYDGEGISGVGGYGYFDVAKRRFQVRNSRALAGYSATAMTITENRIWIALAAHGEYGSSPGGLLGIDRATFGEKRLVLPDLVSSFAKVGRVLVMTTQAGIAAMDGDRVRRFFVDRPVSGPSVVREALP